MEQPARDLLRRFSGGYSTEEVTCGDSDEIELGLSLGGCFSSQDAESGRLIRSTSSIPALLQGDFPTVVPLVRSCSLPSEAEEEIWRRKEMQSIKRMEAKRKREEKRNMKRFDEHFEGVSVGKMRRLEVESSSRRLGSASQGSAASPGNSSSGGSEFESRTVQGIIPASDPSPPSKHSSNKASPVPAASSSVVLRNGALLDGGGTSDRTKKMMEGMPSVSTRGDGPNGRRIEGFLYRYGKGEVSIVCVCHGSFLTPAEFVKHGGGGDVAHPLRHIVMNSSSGSL
ncbi:ninja-family protein AFP3-like [Phalaenopsis equestris]|uniref:ninja-family protein AFP3-like n=1 Tax=Phalaenopsis equestris TaxID=78828 RepID=UPI0009E2BCAB|nr:ninja-family protein AFP3-like [Phalaenopsis equestris]